MATFDGVSFTIDAQSGYVALPSMTANIDVQPTGATVNFDVGMAAPYEAEYQIRCATLADYNALLAKARIGQYGSLDTGFDGDTPRMVLLASISGGQYHALSRECIATLRFYQP